MSISPIENTPTDEADEEQQKQAAAPPVEILGLLNEEEVKQAKAISHRTQQTVMALGQTSLQMHRLEEQRKHHLTAQMAHDKEARDLNAKIAERLGIDPGTPFAITHQGQVIKQKVLM